MGSTFFGRVLCTCGGAYDQPNNQVDAGHVRGMWEEA